MVAGIDALTELRYLVHNTEYKGSLRWLAVHRCGSGEYRAFDIVYELPDEHLVSSRKEAYRPRQQR